MMSPSDVRPGMNPADHPPVSSPSVHAPPELAAFFSVEPGALSLAEPESSWLDLPSEESLSGALPMSLDPHVDASASAVSHDSVVPEPLGERSGELPALAGFLPDEAQVEVDAQESVSPSVPFVARLSYSADDVRVRLEPTQLSRQVPRTTWEQFAPVLSMALPSEDAQMPRAAFLAGSLYLEAQEAPTAAHLTRLVEGQRAGTLLQLVAAAASARSAEGYQEGLHDEDAAALLSALMERHREAPALLVPPEARALGLLFWSTHPDEEARRQWHLRARSLGRLTPQLRSSALCTFTRALGEALRRGLEAQGIEVSPSHIPLAAEWLARELRAATPRFSLSQEASALRDSFLAFLDSSDQRELFRLDLQGLEDRPADRLLLVRAWLASFIGVERPLGPFDHEPFLFEAAVALAIASRVPREVMLLSSWITVLDLRSEHAAIVGGSFSIRADVLLCEVSRMRTELVPLWHRWQAERAAVEGRLLDELSCHVNWPRGEEAGLETALRLTRLERSALFSPLRRLLLGVEAERGIPDEGSALPFRQALVVYVSPSALSPAPVLAHLAQQQQLIHVVIEARRIGGEVRELEPVTAPTQSARLELQRLLLGLELGEHTLLEVRDAHLLHPQLLQTFLPLAEGRDLELVQAGGARRLTLHRRRFVLVFCTRPGCPGLSTLPQALLSRVPVICGMGVPGHSTAILAEHFLERLAEQESALAPLRPLPPARWEASLPDGVSLRGRIRSLVLLARAWACLLREVGTGSESASRADVFLEPALEGFFALAADLPQGCSPDVIHEQVVRWFGPQLPPSRRSGLERALLALLEADAHEGSSRSESGVSRVNLPSPSSPLLERLDSLTQSVEAGLALARAVLPSAQEARELFEARKQQAQQLDGLRLALGAIRRSLEELNRATVTEAQAQRSHLAELLQRELSGLLKGFVEHQALDMMGLQTTLEHQGGLLAETLQGLQGDALARSVGNLAFQVEQNGLAIASQLDAHSKALAKGVESHARLLSGQVDQSARGLASYLQQQGQGLKNQLEQNSEKLHTTLHAQLETGFIGLSAAFHTSSERLEGIVQRELVPVLHDLGERQAEERSQTRAVLHEQLLPALRGLEQSALGLEQTAAGLPLALQLGIQDALGKGIERISSALHDSLPRLEERLEASSRADTPSGNQAGLEPHSEETARPAQTSGLQSQALASLDPTPVVQAIASLQRELHELKEALQALLYRPLVAIAQQSDAIRRGLQESLGRSLSGRLDAFLERLTHLSGAVQHPSGHSVLDELAIISRELEGIRLSAQAAFPGEEESDVHAPGSPPQPPPGR